MSKMQENRIKQPKINKIIEFQNSKMKICTATPERVQPSLGQKLYTASHVFCA